MLGTLTTSRVNQFLAELGLTETTDDFSELIANAAGVWGRTSFAEDEDEDEILLWKRGEEVQKYVKALRHLWGGEIDDVLAVRVFPGGYTVETRTPILDRSTGEMVREVRVGPLAPA